MDLSLIHELFKHCIFAAERLGIDAEFSGKLKDALAKLQPLQIAANGTLQEWSDPAVRITDPHNRHVSLLAGVYPLADITRDEPELWAAAKKSLIARGDGSTGWSAAWRLALWARMGDGDHAYKILRSFFRPVDFGGAKSGGGGGGLYMNFFGSHPPFQMDANFGYTAAVAEMLLQSHETEGGVPVLRLLPALPTGWPKGSVTGLRARGGLTVDVRWEGGKLTSATLRGKPGVKCRINFGEITSNVAIPESGMVTLARD